MTREEAINVLEEFRTDKPILEMYYSDVHEEALEMAIADMEKQIPKKPLDDHLIKTGYWGCPVCKHMVDSVSNYCECCGVALYWSEERE